MQSDGEAREATEGRTAPDPDPPADPAGPTPTLDEAQLDQLLIYARELSTLHQQGREQLQVLRHLHTQLQIKEAQRTRLMSYLMTIQAEERNSIAGALHQGPLSGLQRILLTTERAKRRLAKGTIEETRNDLGRLRQDVQKIVADLRLLINDLRPAVLDTVGLLGALDFLAEQISSESGLTITVSSRLGARLNPTLETVIFRMAQEALANVRDHAAAHTAWIHLARQEDEVHLDIRDDGKGFTAENWRMRALAAGHVGLAGIHERAELVGGQVTIESSPELGTTIHCVLPFLPATPGPGLAANPAPDASPAG